LPLFAGVVALPLLAGALAPRAGATTIKVRSEAEFQSAVSLLAGTGGTVILLPHVYGHELVVARRANKPLRIVARPRARVQRMLLYRTRRVSLGPLTIRPIKGDAWLKVYGSRAIDLHDLDVTASGTAYSASVRLPYSRGVTIRDSSFSHCGDRSLDWAFCLQPRETASNVSVERNWFHDCYGCDFIHGRFGSHLTIRGNRFERALPCPAATDRCRHQDLIELFSGNGLRVENNRFGVYAAGGAQLFLSAWVARATIVNNVFVGTDPRVPFYRARVGIALAGFGHVPRYVKIVNNTILAGAVRLDRYAGSIYVNPRYREVSRRERPLIANNVLALLDTPQRFCRRVAKTVANLVIRGHGCSSSDRIGLAYLDGSGRPTSRSSSVIDGGDGRYSPPADLGGRPRLPSWLAVGVAPRLDVDAPRLRFPASPAASAPDIGAYEYAAPGGWLADLAWSAGFAGFFEQLALARGS
jgi:Right handed beta helix region